MSRTVGQQECRGCDSRASWFVNAGEGHRSNIFENGSISVNTLRARALKRPNDMVTMTLFPFFCRRFA